MIKKFKLTPKLKRKLDRLFSKFIHDRDKVCQICGKTGKLDTAHIIPRSCLLLRWHPDNAILLDPVCHKWGKDSFHQNPLYFSKWYVNKYGQDMVDKLLELSTMKADFTEEKINLIIKNLTKQNGKKETL
jgi:hypothetical protein